jgi:hypothetical protein
MSGTISGSVGDVLNTLDQWSFWSGLAGVLGLYVVMRIIFYPLQKGITAFGDWLTKRAPWLRQVGCAIGLIWIALLLVAVVFATIMGV